MSKSPVIKKITSPIFRKPNISIYSCLYDKTNTTSWGKGQAHPHYISGCCVITHETISM